MELWQVALSKTGEAGARETKSQRMKARWAAKRREEENLVRRRREEAAKDALSVGVELGLFGKLSIEV
jgi:hypothetical protein